MGRWTIIIMLLTGTTLILSYDIEPINNPILPVLKGTSFIVDNRYTVHYHINVTNIILCLKQVEETTLVLNQTLQKARKVEISHLIPVKLNYTFNTINKLKIILSHYVNSKSNYRHKRDLINLVGTAEKWLFGTLDADDGIRYENYIRLLRNNQKILNQDLNSQKVVLEKLTHTLDSQLKTIRI